MRLWFIPLAYAIGSIACALIMPRLEHEYFAINFHGLSVASALAFFSAIASGMLALTGIVFSIAFVLVQFNAIVYSPRLVVWFARDRLLFHSLGVFVATFMYSLSTLAWIDRTGAGRVPLVSSMFVAVMVAISVLLLSWLVQRLNTLQITQVLRIIGDTGRQVIGDTYKPVARSEGQETPITVAQPSASPAALALRHVGEPRIVTSIDIAALAREAQRFNG